MNQKQKEVLAQFYSNAALAWVTFGVIAPFFSKVENPLRTAVGIITSFVIGITLLGYSLKFVK